MFLIVKSNNLIARLYFVTFVLLLVCNEKTMDFFELFFRMETISVKLGQTLQKSNGNCHYFDDLGRLWLKIQFNSMATVNIVLGGL